MKEETKNIIWGGINATSGISINYITLIFIITTHFYLVTGLVILLHHLDKIAYQEHIDMIFLLLRVNYYAYLYFGIALFTNILFRIAKLIKQRED